MRFQHTSEIILSEDTAQQDVVTHQKVRTDVTDAFVNGKGASYQIHPSTMITVPLPSDGTKNGMLHIRADDHVIAQINGMVTLDLIPRAKAESSGETIPGMLMMLARGVSSLTLTNPSSTDVASVYVSWASEETEDPVPVLPTATPLRFANNLFDVYCTPEGVLLTEVYAFKLRASDDGTLWRVTVDAVGALVTSLATFGAPLAAPQYVEVPGTDESRWKLEVLGLSSPPGKLVTSPF